MPQRTDIHGDNVKLAVAVISMTVLALSLGDALIKKTSADLVLWQVFVLRSVLALAVLIVTVKVFYKSLSMMPVAFGWTALRSLMLTAMWMVYYASLPHLALSVAAAAYYTLPIFITLFAALFAGEAVGRLGWLAIGLGFGGVILILRPTTEGFNFYALLPLVSAMLYALAMILTRTKCRGEHPMILSLALNVTFVIVGLAATVLMPTTESFLSGRWGVMGVNEWIAIGLLAVVILIGSIGTAIAYQAGPSSVVATFDFAYVGFAALWGFAFFNEVPDRFAILGMTLIVAAGVLAVRR